MLASFRMAATIAGFATDREPPNNTNPVGAGLLAMRACQSTMTPRNRQQAGSYRFGGVLPNPRQKK
ncbi:hypothetical protein, partial [Pseudomonas sp. C32]|uniref:hypothetical protein n=1 Tax=Pseudomonas sp. C32 TaxID=1529208 RepID=UPI0026046A00